MNVAARAVGYLYGAAVTRDAYVPNDLLGMNPAGIRVQGEVRIWRDLNLIFHHAAILVGARQKMGGNIDAITALALVEFDFVRVQYCDNIYLVRHARSNDDRTISIVDRNHRVLADFEMEVLAHCIGARCQAREDNHAYDSCGIFTRGHFVSL